MYLVVDLETTSKEVKKRKGNPFYNKILCYGLLYQNNTLNSEAKDRMPKGWLNSVKTVIGHGFKYDLLYLWRNDELQNAFKAGLCIWDTQLAEYILSGQRHKYPSLRDIAVNKYGCKERIKHIEQGFKQGLDTSQIDMKLLLEDVQGDAQNTEQVALQQGQLMAKEGMVRLAKAQMDAVLCTTEMEYNGMYVNQDVIKNNRKILQDELVILEEKIVELASKHWPAKNSANISSPQQLSKLFFGGVHKYIDKVEDGVYKSGDKKGQIKYRNVEVEALIPGFGLTPHKDWKGTKDGIYCTDEKVLKAISKLKTHKVKVSRTGNGDLDWKTEEEVAKYYYDQVANPKFETIKIDPDAPQLAKYLLRTRELNKQINTYYTATEELIHEFDSCVHAQLCHCGYESGQSYGGGTSTGRLSSRSPNIQNQPRSADSKVKQHYTSRFPEGIIVEIDFCQLEVCVFAFLCQDRQLISDIVNKVDIHKVLASQLFGISVEEVTKEQRQKIKPCTFHVIYGGGHISLSIRTGLEEEFCEQFIKAFYARYPQAKQWQDNLVRKVESTRRFNGLKTKKGADQEEAYFKSVTGRKYWFESKDSYDNQRRDGILSIFHKPDIKNYPVQGLATADIALIMFGRLWREAIKYRDKFLLINTVHDSVVIDCKKEYVEECCAMSKRVLESVNEMMKDTFNVDFNVPVSVDIKTGKSWWECGL